MINIQPNEARCSSSKITHILELPPCCPVSSNPLPGSKIFISYTPDKYLLEVISLRKYIDSYQGGKGAIRSMEGMLQAITKDCALAVQVAVTIESELFINPNQQIRLTTQHLL